MQGRLWYTVIGSTNTSFLPSFDKGKHARRRVFPALFVLFVLAGASPPASQKPKITRKYIAGRCIAVLSEQKCVQTRKGPQVILAVLPRGLTQYGRISARQNRVCPCQSMVAEMQASIAYFPTQKREKMVSTRSSRTCLPFSSPSAASAASQSVSTTSGVIPIRRAPRASATAERARLAASA